MANPQNPERQINWQGELIRIATKQHIILCWAAIIIDPIWFIADYFTIPAYWKIFFLIRTTVAVITLLALLLSKKINIRNEILAFVPVLGVSLQNAYMWSVMDVPMLQKHALAYTTFFVAASMLLLWKPLWSITVLVINLIANIIFFHLLSSLTTQEILINGGMLVATVAVIFVVMEHSRYVLTKKEIIGRLLLAESNKELALKNEIIEQKNKDITDSINYAKRIQYALLAHEQFLKENLKEHFVLFKPKDIVSGDFYWATKKEDRFYLAVCDSTGHGVPGAFMSLLNISFLNEAVIEKNIAAPNEILDHVRKRLIENISQDGGQDGMDAILFCVEKNKMSYAAANNASVIIHNGEIHNLPYDSMPVGKGDKADNFKLQTLDLKPGDCFYLFTDGYADQFGGAKGKKFKYKQLEALLSANSHQPLAEQKNILEKTFNDWKRNLEQVDDVLVIGIKI